MLAPALPIETKRLRLRAYRDADYDFLLSVQSREDVTRYLYWGPRSAEEVRRTLEMRSAMTQIAKEGDGLVLAIERKDTAALAGDVCLTWTSDRHSQGEIGYILHPDHHGHGFAVEATAELLRLGFEDLGLHRIYGRCDPRNEPSMKVMARLGMRQEGLLRENEHVKGEWTSEAIFAMLADEWHARR